MTDPYGPGPVSGPGPSPATPPQPLAPNDERLWASLAQYGNIIGFLPSLLIFLILGPRSAFVKTQAKEALNFVITAIAAYIVLFILGAIVTVLYIASSTAATDALFGLIGTLINLVEFAIWVLVIVFSIVAGLKVNRGEAYRYPFAIRLIK